MWNDELELSDIQVFRMSQKADKICIVSVHIEEFQLPQTPRHRQGFVEGFSSIIIVFSFFVGFFEWFLGDKYEL